MTLMMDMQPLFLGERLSAAFNLTHEILDGTMSFLMKLKTPFGWKSLATTFPIANVWLTAVRMGLLVD